MTQKQLILPMKEKKKSNPWWPNKWSASDLVGLTLGVLFLPIILPIVICYLLAGFILHLAIWLMWCTRGQHLLFVYSNSPVWQEHIEHKILPRLPQNAVVLNWSERRNWGRLSLAVQAFNFFGGRREFNPLAVIFRPFHLARTFRFWDVFNEYKHGKTEPLANMERDMFEYLVSLGQIKP